MNLDNLHKNSRSIVAFIIILCGFAVLFSIIFWDFPSDQKDIYYSIAGVVGTLLSLVVSYYFGASKTEGKNDSSEPSEKSNDKSEW